MKKISAAVVATAMAASMLAPTADAASNTMSIKNNTKYCTLHFDSDGFHETLSQAEAKRRIKADVDLKKLAEMDLSKVQQSSQVSEAFGSSTAADTAEWDEAMAVQACVKGENFQSEPPMDDGTKAGIIIGFVLGILGLLGGLVQQAGLLR